MSTEPNPAAPSPASSVAPAQSADPVTTGAAGPEVGAQKLQLADESAPAHSYSFDGLEQLGEHDRPVVDDFATAMSRINAPQEVIRGAWDWYQGQVAQQARQQELRDQQAAAEAGEILRAEMGETEYGITRGLIRAWIGDMPASLQSALRSAVNDDGVPIFSDVAALRWFVAAARRGAPVSPHTPKEVELAELKEQMRDPAAWSKDAAGQARYRDLIRDNVQPGWGAVPGGSADREREKTELMRMAAMPRGSAGWNKYWKGGGEERYRQLIGAPR